MSVTQTLLIKSINKTSNSITLFNPKTNIEKEFKVIGNVVSFLGKLRLDTAKVTFNDQLEVTFISQQPLIDETKVIPPKKPTPPNTEDKILFGQVLNHCLNSIGLVGRRYNNLTEHCEDVYKESLKARKKILGY